MPGTSGHSRRRGRAGRTRHGGGGTAPTAAAASPSASVSAAGSGGSGGIGTPSGRPDSEPLSAAGLYKEAQAATNELKAMLQTQPPWSREADAVRQRARNTYLAVLFQHPLSPHAQTLDTLWLATTYTLIQAYRDIVARIEAALPPRRGAKDNTSAGAKEGGGSGNDKNGNGTGGSSNAAADLRRTLARFRQALVAEDAFYRSLIGRIVGFYRLQERARDHLAVAGVPVPAVGEGDVRDPSLAPVLSREEEEKKLGLVYKGLICLGDLERYKEQYSERARRDARDGVPPRDTKFERAVMFYEVARGLQADNGMAFNQLAVIDGYLGENFPCTYHYFRALAVRQPFPGGEANLERVLKRAFDRWRVARHDGDPSHPGSPQDDRDACRRDLLVLCSILFLKASTSHVPSLRDAFCEGFGRLLRARKLPSETIVKTTAMVIGSHWYARLDTGKAGGSTRAHPNEAAKAERRRHVEDLALGFLFSLFTALVVATAQEVEESLAAHRDDNESAVADDDEEGRDPVLALAQRITAVVRRILPSLRIMSHWLKIHLDYVARASAGVNPEVRDTIATFWAQYKTLMLAMARLFPLAQLPSLDGPLEEDIDMRGFLPLTRGSFEETPTDPQRQDVHPNEEQLMRIADLLVDVKLLMQTEAGSRALNAGAPLPTAPFVAPGTSETVSVSVSTETEDDPVNLAMRATLTEGGSSVGDRHEDAEEEVIMWGRSTPVGEPQARQIPSAQNAQDLLQNLTLSSRGPQPGPSTAPPPPLLFGGDAVGGGSIWTMSREESQKGAQRSAHAAVPWQTDPHHQGAHGQHGHSQHMGPSPQAYPEYTPQYQPQSHVPQHGPHPGPMPGQQMHSGQPHQGYNGAQNIWAPPDSSSNIWGAPSGAAPFSSQQSRPSSQWMYHPSG